MKNLDDLIMRVKCKHVIDEELGQEGIRSKRSLKWLTTSIPYSECLTFIESCP